MSKIFFISRHELTPAQKATLKACGFDEYERKEIVFDFPVQQLEELGILAGEAVAVVAPLWVGAALLDAGYTVIEFRNRPSSRAKGVFICEGATRMRLGLTDEESFIEQEFVESPISPEDQEEVPVFSVIS